MKKIIVIIVLIFALTINTGQVLALSGGEVPIEIEHDSELDLALILTILPTLSVSGSTASYRLTVTCITSVNSIHATLQLQQWNNNRWNDFGSSWTDTASTWRLTSSGTRAVTAGRTYRLKVTIVASNNSTTASATAYSS